MAQFELKKTYKFDTLAPSILGASYSNVKVIGIITAAEAKKYRDIHTLHNTVSPVISGLPAVVNDLTYILFKKIEGDEEFVLAKEYIDIFTIQLVTTTNLRITMENITTDTASVISARLKELGFYNFELQLY